MASSSTAKRLPLGGPRWPRCSASSADDDVETLTKALGPMERLADQETGHDEG